MHRKKIQIGKLMPISLRKNPDWKETAKIDQKKFRFAILRQFLPENFFSVRNLKKYVIHLEIPIHLYIFAKNITLSFKFKYYEKNRKSTLFQ